MIASAVRNAQMYELKGLAEEDSWLLFEQMVFEKGRERADADLVEIGKDIVKKCANVPLSIRVIGSMLYGQDRGKWLLFQKNDLAKIQEANDRTMAILRSSYYHLNPPLKSCFSCCALFPKDHKIWKEDLIHLWMACGFLAPQYNGQSIEDVGEDYFSILVQRCFFQDIARNTYSEIAHCKIHDLMHDLAEQVGKQDLLVLPSGPRDSGRKTRHLSIRDGCENISFAEIKNSHVILQTLEVEDRIHGSRCIGEDGASKIISHGRCLRFLDLGSTSLRSVPSVIDKLLHLRYLDLSLCVQLEMLPRSITKLSDLQVLKLGWCEKLRALPVHFSRLVNLRYLDIWWCMALTRMPKRMKELTCLHTLTMFVVGGDSMSCLEDLKALVHLKDDLTVEIKEFCSNETSKIEQGAYLLDKQHLKKLKLVFDQSDRQGQEDVQEALLEGFQPNHNLRKIEISGYTGVKFPTWALWENTMRSLPLLVKIELSELHRLQRLPSFSQLRSLEELLLRNIPNLEYMESESSNVSSAHWTFYPSLRKLVLWKLEKVKGWWRDGVTVDAEGDGRGCSSSTREQGGGNGHQMSSLLLFPNLRQLNIHNCPNMKLFPPCPHVEELKLKEFNEELVFGEKIGRVDNQNQIAGLSTTTASSGDIDADTGVESVHVVPHVFALKKLTIDNSGFISRLPEESTQDLHQLNILGSEEERLPTGEVFQRCASSLQSLRITYCRTLKRLCGGGIEHLTCLQDLHLYGCDELELEDEDENGMPWNSLHSLSSLTLSKLPKLAKLPKGIQNLTALHSLSIRGCASLRALPEWLGCLSSLRFLDLECCDELKSLPEAMRDLTCLTRLEISHCGHLTDRCKGPNGEDWPKLRHIPHFILNGKAVTFDGNS